MGTETEKSRREMRVFQAFVERSGLPVVAGSAESRSPPEPDILCEVDGQGRVAFELKENCAPELARVGAASEKAEVGGVVYTRVVDPTRRIARKAKTRSYEGGHPVELLVYADGRVVTTPQVSMEHLRNVFGPGRHPYRRVWFMAFHDDVCECVVDRTCLYAESRDRGLGHRHHPSASGRSPRRGPT